MYRSVFELELLKIKHETNRVIVQGAFTSQLGEEAKMFATVMDRVDGSLDYFL